MALNYSVSYKAGATSRLDPPISLDRPQQYASDPLRLTIDMNGFNGTLVFENTHGVMAYVVEGIYTFDGPAVLLNKVLGTLRYSPSVNGTNTGAAPINLYRYVNIGEAQYENLDNGSVSFFTRGFNEGQLPPVTNLTPRWITSPVLGSVTTGQNFIFEMRAVLGATLRGEEVAFYGANDRAIAIASTHTIRHLTINGTPLVEGVDYTRDIDLIRIHTNIRNGDSVDLACDAPMTYQRMHDDLPVALAASDDSFAYTIEGQLGLLSNMTLGQTRTFRIGMRAIASNGSTTDRTFTISATSTSSGGVPSWNMDTPSFIGAYTRGSPISFEIGIMVPIGSYAEVVETSTSMLVADEYRGLPVGVTVGANGLVSGVIDPSTGLGVHYFRLSLRDSDSNEVAYREFSLLVNSPVGALEPLRFIRWVTPEGSIGSFTEGEKCPVGVRAYSTTTETVTYELIPATTPLPLGLTLNRLTGDFEGVFGHMHGATNSVVYNFTVRASVGNTFVDGDFSMSVAPRYRNDGATNVHLRVRKSESRVMVDNYETVIQESEYFRPEDENFGRVDSPLIYVIGGLSRSANANPNEGPDPDDYTGYDYVAAAIRNSNFGGPIRLRLGKHRIAKVRVNGAVVYEVLYREVYDPLQLAGGFTYNLRGEPVREALPHPQSTRHIYPESLTNFRNDLILQVGFDSFNESMNLRGGIGGPENLPEWMSSPQTASPSSAIGYIPAATIAYLKPNTGAAVLDRLAVQRHEPTSPVESANPLADDHEIWFDQFYLTFTGSSNPTYFDDWNTVFENGVTTFDDRIIQEGKYQRMNPKGR